jgi:hypothetical protein
MDEQDPRDIDGLKAYPTWFLQQLQKAGAVFLPYVDFREP